MAALLAGQSVTQVAEMYQIPHQTVSEWAQANGIGEVRQKKDIGELVGAYLNETLETLRTQAEFARNLDWLRQQPASEFAVLHGVMSDKAIRILEAAERARAAQQIAADAAESPDTGGTAQMETVSE